MKTEKGITLASVLIYVTTLGIIVGVVALAMSFYNKNIVAMNDTGDINLELNKFITQIIDDTQEKGNKIEDITETRIRFLNGNTYTFKDERIYINSRELSNCVKEFNASMKLDGDKQVLQIDIVLEKGQARVEKRLNYVLEITK